eukprot:CAMPEP_0181173162 /NCGR_PEP_ID=MMETSP1096-20121128/2848_1 /TAXON_ID=156174 ORGANISM="Chrysochromulina ericina, Strain CCMP281" /NCGR_SAMPLE_ID=MMETSP1096 /ASSEMBLY_ACC=CAM_ASM_000453 /LENGTH=143 /DNA_ID=CAMNT_0023260963 /DNA_START=205 /DNA_END=633 /DNA_ORIENTATION=-
MTVCVCVSISIVAAGTDKVAVRLAPLLRTSSPSSQTFIRVWAWSSGNRSCVPSKPIQSDLGLQLQGFPALPPSKAGAGSIVTSRGGFSLSSHVLKRQTERTKACGGVEASLMTNGANQTSAGRGTACCSWPWKRKSRPSTAGT